MRQLEDKVCIVTGAAGSIGLATAKLLIEEGARVMLVDLDEENLKKGLVVMHDYATGALLLEDEIKRESGVILAEMRSRDSADYRTFKASLRFELPDLLVSQRLPIGKTETIKNADRALLKGFYDDWYRPENMMVVVVEQRSEEAVEFLREESPAGEAELVDDLC